jgi:tRNA nucleotidyltransferase (CCA-adding enzyme)
VKTYVVGGYIRDQLLGIVPKDKDYVVVGASPAEMQAQGYIPVGQDFPVFLHPITKEEYALARTERKTGQGYKGFTFYATPEVTIEQDLYRRDFTMNAIAQEINSNGELVGPLIDPYGGQNDIQSKVIRHVSAAFSEDPLRILRLARLMARLLEFQVEEKTLLMVKKMVHEGELRFLVPERVWLEISRGLLELKPSRMIQVLIETSAVHDVLPQGFKDAEVLQKTLEAIDLGVKQSDLQIQVAFLLAFVDLNELEEWTANWKIPTELKNFAKIFHQFFRVRQIKNMSAEQALNFFNQSDASRKLDRLEKVIGAASLLGINIQLWQKLLEAFNSVDAGQIAKNLQSTNGLIIQNEIVKTRLQAISACL